MKEEEKGPGPDRAARYGLVRVELPTGITQETNWAAIAPAVAIELLGEPSRKKSREWRWGRNGSFALTLDKGTWSDFETGENGGVLALIERETGCDRPGACEWLQNRGHLERRARRTPPNGRTARPPTPAMAPKEKTESQAMTAAYRTSHAQTLWAASVCADQTPVRGYLSARFTWPPDGTGPDLPADVRWLPREGQPANEPAAQWYGLPEGSAGAVVFAFRHRGTGSVSAVAIEALAGDGKQWLDLDGKRWRRTFGPRSGCTFRPAARPGARLLLVEGGVDALAACWFYPNLEAHGVGGTSGIKSWELRPGDPEPLIVMPDGDKAGIDAARQLSPDYARTVVRC